MTQVVPDRRAVDRAAKTLRASVAIELADPFLASFDRDRADADVARSPFRDHVRDLPFDDPLHVAAFNLSITQAAASRALAQSSDPLWGTFAAARIAELGLYALHTPSDPAGKPVVFLAQSKRWGYFFTPPEVAVEMARLAVSGRRSLGDLLDPAAGVGSLLVATVWVAHASGVGIERVRAIELDDFTAQLCGDVLRHVLPIMGAAHSLTITNGDGIEILAEDASSGKSYTTIVMNPPYGRAKFLRSNLTNKETRTSEEYRTHDEQATELRTRASQTSKRLRDLADVIGHDKGPQDFQRTFMALATAATSVDGRMVAITPSNWMGDAGSARLRGLLVASGRLNRVHVIPESARLFATVNQPTAISVVSGRRIRDSFTVSLEDPLTGSRQEHEVPFASVETRDPARLRIPTLPRRSLEVLDALVSFPPIGSLPWIAQGRGELDLTVDKDVISSEPTETRLIRGDHLERYVLRNGSSSPRDGYVRLDQFLPTIANSKSRYRIDEARLIGRQVSYLKKPRRLSFAVCPPGFVVANSCNYLAVINQEVPEPWLKALLVVLNSAVSEWLFRVYSSNNHVGNYEIAELRSCITSANVSRLAAIGDALQQLYLSPQHDSSAPSAIEDLADAVVAAEFGLDGAQIEAIFELLDPGRASRISALVDYLSKRGPSNERVVERVGLQHDAPSLSDLDRLMIEFVPQGGNWQDIPPTVPSSRIAQIREMTRQRGIVRTTYYGRLRPDQPAYTIATYYNRPGNGSNIHPWEDRTLTNREAGRLQSFPDWYTFQGRDSEIRNQIGNAVPPLLGLAVGRTLLQAGVRPTAVDLFCGAGGLSLGLEFAGFEIPVGVDIDGPSRRTYGINRPLPGLGQRPLAVLGSDLSTASGLEEVAGAVRQMSGGHLGLLAGGPPCQGFSHAGWRAHEDKRNDLAVSFMRLVEILRPESVLLENVEGLLSFGHGRVVDDLLRTLRDLGYSTGQSPWVLSAEQYGVPQMRRRVFLIASRVNASIMPPEPIFQKCRGRREFSGAGFFGDGLPYPFTVAEALRGLPRIAETMHPAIGSRTIRGAYSEWITSAARPSAMLTKFADNSS